MNNIQICKKKKRKTNKEHLQRKKKHFEKSIRVEIYKRKSYNNLLRALALGNANAKCKGHLAFAAPKTIASENCKQQYCKFFCNTVTVQF